MINDTEHVRERQKQVEVFEVVQDLGILTWHQRFREQMVCAAIINLKVQLASCLSARRTDRVNFDVINVAVVTDVVVDPQMERFIPARTTSYTGIALLNNVEPVVLAIKEKVVRRTRDTASRGNGLIPQKPELERIALTLQAFRRGCCHVVYETIPAELRPANERPC
ncbi:MAG: hypothetical protein U0936_21365 [Planctomycetaceae bacterium]